MSRSIFFRRLAALSMVAVSTAALVACGGGGDPSSGASSLLMEAGGGPKESNAPVTGAIWTSEIGCVAVNTNIYEEREAVYLNGGPAKKNDTALLPNTSFYVQVTSPDGEVLGSSVNMANPTPFVTNTLGVPGCLQLWSIVQQPGGAPGYAETTNNGGEYKVWISTASDFTNSLTKTDNFKVKVSTPPPPPPPVQGKVIVSKWYDANANGLWDAGEPELTGWNVDLTLQAVMPTKATYGNLPLNLHVAREFAPVEQNWLPTNAFLGAAPGALNTIISNNAAVLNAINVPLAAENPEQTVSFGNVCVGAGGGLTKGFWGNKNGEAAFTKKIGTSTALAALVALNLRNENGTDFDPANYKLFNAWLQDSRAVNMAFMLSAQLAAMQLNVMNGNVSGGAMVYAPGALGANSAGFMSVNALISEANDALGLWAVTRAGVPQRVYQEWLKNALDAGNNNRNFAQATPCVYSFASVAPAAPTEPVEPVVTP